jgi:hypothetical protein
MPYSPLTKSCLSVKDKTDWIKHCKTLLHEKGLAKELGQKLFEAVQGFSIEKVNKKRYKLYRDVLKNKHMDSSGNTGRVVTLDRCTV